MSVMRVMTQKAGVWVLAAVILVVFGWLSPAYGAAYVAVWPGEDKAAQAAAQVSLKSYEIRKGSVHLAPDMVPQTATAGAAAAAKVTVSQGDAITMTFFDDVTYQVTVDAVMSHQDGTMSISGRLGDHNLGTVVLTVGAEGFLMTLQDLNRSLLYRVTGNSRTATGTATEIDVTKIPPMIR